MLSIKSNMMAENAARNLGKSYDTLAQSVQRLSSGQRINSSKDDAAGLAVSELIRADVATLQQGSRNGQDGVSMLQTAEGAMGVMDDILVRMKELAEQASTDSYSSAQRAIMNNEFGELSSEIDRIAGNTSFNTLKLLDATTETLNIHVGTSQMISIATTDVTAAGLGIGATKSTGTWSTWDASPNTFANVTTAGTLTFAFAGQTAFTTGTISTGAKSIDDIKNAINAASRATTEAYDAAEVVYDEATGMSTLKVSAKGGGASNNLTVSSTTLVSTEGIETVGKWSVANGTGTGQALDTAAHARTALAAIDTAITNKDSYRAKLGYLMNRLQSAITVDGVQAENLMTAQSRITDVDVATEMANMTRTQVLAQAGISMLTQANTMPQMALSLLRG